MCRRRVAKEASNIPAPGRWRGGRGGGLSRRRGGFFRGSRGGGILRSGGRSSGLSRGGGGVFRGGGRRRGGFLRGGGGRGGGRLGLVGAELGGGRVAALNRLHARLPELEDAVVGVVAPEVGGKRPVSMETWWRSQALGKFAYHVNVNRTSPVTVDVHGPALNTVQAVLPEAVYWPKRRVLAGKLSR